jgi:heat shock protein HtpX
MFKSHGLHSYVLNNHLKSIGLLGAFLAIVQLILGVVWVLVAVWTVPATDFTGVVLNSLNVMLSMAPAVLAGSMVWLGLAFLFFKRMLRKLSGLHPVSRIEEPRLYNIVENLSISVGLTPPQIEVTESPALNAFAMGLTPAHSTIGVTRGLLNSLTDKELEAVIAHELTHIRTYDVRLMTLATIFTGMIFSVGWVLTYRIREFARMLGATGVLGKIMMIFWVTMSLGILAFAIGIEKFSGVIGLTTCLVVGALLGGLSLRFTISRTREFMADAGAVELTKNPEALISALIKVHGRSLMPGSDTTLQAMMISAPANGEFSSHPDLESRIDAIVNFAATRLQGLRLAPASARHIPDDPVECDGGAGFAITRMKYPAWISNPLIVMPSLLVGWLVYNLTARGLVVTVDMFASMPGYLKDVYNADTSSSAFVFNSAAPDQKFDAPSLMDAGTIKMVVIMGGISFVISRVARELLRRGFLPDGDYVRNLCGLPSKVMDDDWHDDARGQAHSIASLNLASSQVAASPGLSRLEAAMDVAARRYQEPAANTHAQQQQAQWPVGQSQSVRAFGKRPG